MLPVMRRFFSFGDAISRYTWARVSNPLIDSSEWPNAMMTATIGMVHSCIVPSQPLPNHPRLSSVKCRLAGVGAGGICDGPRISSVRMHQPTNRIRKFAPSTARVIIRKILCIIA